MKRLKFETVNFTMRYKIYVHTYNWKAIYIIILCKKNLYKLVHIVVHRVWFY